MFLTKYSPSAKVFACVSIAFVFGLLAWRLIPIAPFIDHSVKSTGRIIGYSDDCVQVQYLDSEGHKLIACNADLASVEVGSDIEIWYVESIPSKVMVEDPILVMFRSSLVGFGWFLTVMACMWWYAMRLENWTQAQGLTLLTISFVPPWNNPLGKILRINLILRTYKILAIDKMGRECVAWIRFKTLFLPTAKPTVLWEGDLHGSSSNDNERSLEQPVLPPGGLADKLAKRKEERKGELERVTAARKPQDELLF